jgi:hypothetical protein
MKNQWDLKSMWKKERVIHKDENFQTGAARALPKERTSCERITTLNTERMATHEVTPTIP